jgi:hypothetical protein
VVAATGAGAPSAGRGNPSNKRRTGGPSSGPVALATAAAMVATMATAMAAAMAPLLRARA